MEFRILGPLEVVAGKSPIDLGRRQQRALLVRLLLDANDVVSTDRLVDDLWGEDAPASALATLQTHISRLRKALGSSADLVTKATGYVLRVADDAVDARRFERLVGSAREARAAGELQSVVAFLDEGLALWRGPALAEVGDAEFARNDAARLEELKLTAIEERVDARLALGHHGELVGELDGLVDEFPLRERFWGLRMLALYRCGRQAEALRAYQALRETLADELGIDPSPDVRRLEAAILQQDASLDLGAHPPVVPTSPPFDGPRGTVTLLFTDVEGSTRLLQALGDRYGGVLADHHQLLRDAWARHGGVVVDTQGDAFFVVFASAGAALAAALDAQQSFVAHPWPDDLPVRVRMGIHTGEAAFEAGVGYVGVAVHEAARVAAAAWGGQVLVSDATRQVAELPAGAYWRDLGEHQLQDLARPLRLAQLCHADLAGEFPRVRSIDVTRHNLPEELTSFVGREAEVAELLDQLEVVRLLTIVGPGGAGKTRLALRTARRSIDRHDDGVWFVELAPVQDGSGVAAQVASVLGVREAPGLPLEAALVEHVRTRALLLVLDNCEHVVAEAARLTDSLLRSCRGLTVLATSREALGVAGEATSAAGGLPDFEAVQLFVERAAAARAGFALDGTNAADIGEICRRLDGIPLALELAAARLRMLDLSDLSARLADRFAVLTGGPRTLAPRQQTLRALVDWSHDLLDDDERVVFRRLSVFAGSGTIEAAESVCGIDPLEPPMVLDLLARLADKSMISLPAGGRWTMLETLREYASEKLSASGEAEAARSRHCAVWIAVAEAALVGLDSSDQDTWLDRLDVELDNIRTALSWAAASDASSGLALAADIWRFWRIRGYWSEGRRWLELLLDATELTAARFLALSGVSALAHAQGDLVAAAQWRGELVELARAGGPSRLAAALGNLGITVWLQGDYERARELHTESLGLQRDLDDRLGAGRSLLNLGLVAQSLGDLDQARELFDESEEVGHALGENSLVINAQIGRAWIARLAGEPAVARDITQAALALAREHGNREAEPTLQFLLGDAALALTDLEVARRALAAALADGRGLGSRTDVAEALEAVARFAVVNGAAEPAAELLGAADRLREVTGYVVPPSEHAMRADLQGVLAVALGADAMQAAISRGHDLGFDAACDAGAALVGHPSHEG